MPSYSKVLTISREHTVATNLQSVKISEHLRSTIKQGEPAPQNAPMPPTLSFSKGGSNRCDHNSEPQNAPKEATLSGTSWGASLCWFKRERRITSSHTDSRVKGGQTITQCQAGEIKDVRKS